MSTTTIQILCVLATTAIGTLAGAVLGLLSGSPLLLAVMWGGSSGLLFGVAGAWLIRQRMASSGPTSPQVAPAPPAPREPTTDDVAPPPVSRPQAAPALPSVMVDEGALEQVASSSHGALFANVKPLVEPEPKPYQPSFKSMLIGMGGSFPVEAAPEPHRPEVPAGRPSQPPTVSLKSATEKAVESGDLHGSFADVFGGFGSDLPADQAEPSVATQSEPPIGERMAEDRRVAHVAASTSPFGSAASEADQDARQEGQFSIASSDDKVVQVEDLANFFGGQEIEDADASYLPLLDERSLSLHESTDTSGGLGRLVDDVRFDDNLVVAEQRFATPGLRIGDDIEPAPTFERHSTPTKKSNDLRTALLRQASTQRLADESSVEDGGGNTQFLNKLGGARMMTPSRQVGDDIRRMSVRSSSILDDGSNEEVVIRALYQEYLSALRRCGQNGKMVDYDAFQRKVEVHRSRMRSVHGEADLTMRVKIDSGKPRIEIRPKA